MCSGRWPAGLLALASVVLLGACTTPSDDARVLQVVNQRGFGRPTQDANRQYYVGIGDGVVLRAPNYPEYNGVSERVRMDGVITLPHVGEVFINGLTPTEATEVVRLRYSELITDTSGMELNVTAIASKKWYLLPVLPPIPRAIPFQGDQLLLDVVAQSGEDMVLVDDDMILVVRGDPENPLIIQCDYDDIVEKGITRDNIPIRENDIVILEPSIVGWIGRFVNMLVAPLTPIQQLFSSANSIVSTTNSFGSQQYGNYNNNNNGFNQF